jgi:hypothetical protein
MKIILLILLCFVGTTAAVCGAAMTISRDGSPLQLSRDLLKLTPFRDFFIPGLVLLAVGLTNLIAAILLLFKKRKWYPCSIASGTAISGWILTQMILIQTVNGMQILYLVAGLFIVLLSWQLSGKWAV